MQSLAQLSQGWGGLLGQQQQQFPFGGQTTTSGNNFSSAGTNYSTGQSGIPNFLPPGATVSAGAGLYGGSSITSGAPKMPFPSDGRDYVSYLQAQVAGGALQGQTSVNQADGIPGTRFYSVQPSSSGRLTWADNMLISSRPRPTASTHSARRASPMAPRPCGR